MATVLGIVRALRGENPKTGEAVPGYDRDVGTTRTGARIYRAHADSERYEIDFAPDFTSQGWAQFDTDQDAHYFGVWVNWAQMRTLTYAEGDWSLVECENREQYLAEVRGMIEFYGAGRVARCIGDDGSVVDVVQDRSHFLRGPGETPTIGDVLRAIGGGQS